jgi:hypothetical protein
LRCRSEAVGPDTMNGLASELNQLPPEVLDVLPGFTAAIARAADRGEIGPHPVPAHVLAVPHDLLRHELVIRHYRPIDAELARIIDNIANVAIQHASHHPGPSQPGRGSAAPASAAPRALPAGHPPGVTVISLDTPTTSHQP